MRRLALAPMMLLGALTALTVGCATPLETTRVPLDPTGWKVGHQADGGAGRGTITEWIPEGERIEAWSELITILSLEGMKDVPAADAVQELFALQDETYTNVQRSIVEQDEWSVLFEWILQDSEPHPDQHELVRMIQGNQAMHRVSYTHKGPPLTEAERAKWLDLLRRCQVVLDGQPIR